jgi:hypothetical protein
VTELQRQATLLSHVHGYKESLFTFSLGTRKIKQYNQALKPVAIKR